MKSKICPSCGSENDNARINCWNCATSIQSSEVVELNNDSAMQLVNVDDSVIRISPIKPINCYHCNIPFLIKGMGVFLCPKCHKENEYYGPYHIDCESCSIRLIVKHMIPSKPVIKCQKCGQHYHISSHFPKKSFFRKIWEFYKSLSFLQG